MAKKPEDRYQSVDEMRAALFALSNELTMPPGKRADTVDTMLSLGSNIKLVSRRNPLRWIILSIIAGFAGVLAIFAFLNFGNSPKNLIIPADKTNPIKIGILHSFTGSMSDSEQIIVDAYKLAIQEINAKGGVMGRAIEPVRMDGESKDEVFAERARELVADKEICTIFGCCTSGSRKAVQEVVEQNNHLLVYSVNTEGVETSPNIIYLGGDANQTIIPFIKWAYAWGGKRTYFLVGSDYIFPHVVNEMVKDRIENLGATLLGEEYISLDATDVSDVLDKIESTKPDAIINMISGDAQIAFLRGLQKRKIKVTQFATGIGEEVLRKVSYNPLVDNYSCCTYFQSLPSEENEQFVKDFKQAYGDYRVVISSMEVGYVALHMWAQAVEEAQSLEPLKIRDAMLKQEYNGPSGLVSIDHETQYSIRNAYIGLANEEGQFEVVYSSTGRVKPDPYPDDRTQQDWDNLLLDLYRGWGDAWTAPPAE
ncbi:MAG: transporter substrate-binding protein [Planctomycetaceae bacterium]